MQKVDVVATAITPCHCNDCTLQARGTNHDTDSVVFVSSSARCKAGDVENLANSALRILTLAEPCERSRHVLEMLFGPVTLFGKV